MHEILVKLLKYVISSLALKGQYREMVVLTIPTYTVTRPYRGFRHPDWMAPDLTVREGNILSLAYAGILHSSMLSFRKTFLEFRVIFLVKKEILLSFHSQLALKVLTCK
jgi:hypothetical protein